MAGTEREAPENDELALPDAIEEESDNIDESDEGGNGGFFAGVTSSLGGAFRRGDRDDDQDEVEAEDEGADEDAEASGGLLGRVREKFDSEEEDVGPSRAELVDGANVLFIDPAAKSKSLNDYQLVLITAPQYPEPIVLKNDAPIEIPAGSVLCSAKSATMIQVGGKRVIARSYILVPPSRADEVNPDFLESVPEPLVDKTIPNRRVQNEQFYNLVLNGVAASK